MTEQEQASLPPLKTIKYNQDDLFIVDALDVALKSDIASMEFPFYSLTTKPEREVKVYEKDGKRIEFRPSIEGLPTIFDKDLLVFAISHAVREMNLNGTAPSTVTFRPIDYFKFTHRAMSGRDYDLLMGSIDRLDGSRIKTNVRIGDSIIDGWFGIVEKAGMKTKTLGDGRNKPTEITIKFSDMVMEQINCSKVLTLHKDYFRLRRAIDRRVYEIARKHCGQQKSWSILLSSLQQKTGSKSPLRTFRLAIKKLAESGNLLDYLMYFDSDEDKVYFFPRTEFMENIAQKSISANIPKWAINKVNAFLPHKNGETLLKEWEQVWIETGSKKLENPIGAFIGYCKKQANGNNQKSLF